MPTDSDRFDFFLSYARSDNAAGWVTRIVEELLVEHRRFIGDDPGRELKPFFDKQDIRSFDDWQQRIRDGLAKSRLFVAFISPSYFVSEWCRREWKGWVDTEIAKHILSAGAAPIYFVEVPGFVGKVPGLTEQATLSEQQVAAKIAELCGLPRPHDSFATSVAPFVQQMIGREPSCFNAALWQSTSRASLRTIPGSLPASSTSRGCWQKPTSWQRLNR